MLARTGCARAIHRPRLRCDRPAFGDFDVRTRLASPMGSCGCLAYGFGVIACRGGLSCCDGRDAFQHRLMADRASGHLRVIRAIGSDRCGASDYVHRPWGPALVLLSRLSGRRSARRHVRVALSPRLWPCVRPPRRPAKAGRPQGKLPQRESTASAACARVREGDPKCIDLRWRGVETSGLPRRGDR